MAYAVHIDTVYTSALLCVHNGESIGQFKCPLWVSRLMPVFESSLELELRVQITAEGQACKKMVKCAQKLLI